MANGNSKGTLEKILTATIDGLAKGDLSGLNDAVEDSVASVLDSVEDTIQRVGEIKTNGQAKPFSTYESGTNFSGATKARQEYIRTQNEARRKEAEALRLKKQQELEAKRKKQSKGALSVPFKPVGDVSSTLCMVFGGIGTGIFGLSTIFNTFSLIIGTRTFASVVASLAFAFFSLTGIGIGISQKKRLQRAYRYASLCGDKKYMSIEDLAAAVNTSPRRLLSDIKTILKKGFYPEGHIDADKTTLMLQDSVYDEYIRVQKGRKELECANVFDTTAREVVDDDSESSSELEDMIFEGAQYIEKFRALNDEIPGEAISEKLDRLDVLLKEIFDCVKKHPEQRSRMHEVMSYYLPTVLKLVEAYKEYDSVSEAGSEILDAKLQIEGSIDTINGALKTILNNLFRDSVWDVTTDATVLNTMLAQKGLT